MATAYKRLGATTCTANTDTLLYAVPSSTSTVVSSIVVCNQTSTAATFRIATCPGSIGSVVSADYVAYDATVQGNDTIVLTIGATLATTNTILVRSSATTVSFTAYGSEIS